MKTINVMSLSLVIFFIGCSGKMINIKPLSPYTNDDSVAANNRCKYFFIEHYSSDSNKLKQVIDFAFKQKELDKNAHYGFEVAIYQKTGVLNESFVSSPQDDIAWHSKDMKFLFRWANNEYMGYLEYEDDKCLNCDSNMELKKDTLSH